MLENLDELITSVLKKQQEIDAINNPDPLSIGVSLVTNLARAFMEIYQDGYASGFADGCATSLSKEVEDE